MLELIWSIAIWCMSNPGGVNNSGCFLIQFPNNIMNVNKYTRVNEKI